MRRTVRAIADVTDMAQMKHLQHDYRFMPQITSSAIW